jgi:hypothetical protein
VQRFEPVLLLDHPVLVEAGQQPASVERNRFRERRSGGGVACRLRGFRDCGLEFGDIGHNGGGVQPDA